jgi:tRNA(fMet)-specific endonuclease VapC
VEAAGVGVILDSSILIAAERAGQTVRQILTGVRAAQGEIDVGISVVTMAELFHGAYRADSGARQQRRLEFIAELRRDVPVYPVTFEVVRLVGKIGGQQAAKGIRIPFEDLVIGATALDLGYSVVTRNVRHFRLIPDLPVVQL